MKDKIKKICQHELTKVFIGSLLLNMIIECLSRRSLIGVVWIVTSPVLFVYNSLIIMLTLSVALLFRRRIFGYTLISIIWLILGLIDCVVLSARKTPFTAMDIYLLSDAVKVIPIYLNVFQMILIGVGIILGVAGLVTLWVKAPKSKEKVNYIKSTIRVLGVALITFIVSRMMISGGIIPEHFGNLANAYKEYGFAHCFSCSVINRGISKPNEYSDNYIDELKQAIEEVQDSQENDYPNVIFLQLESFINPNQVKGVTYSENPVPNFEMMYSNYTSGYLSVPCVGAGTANTEFEVQTGMNIEDFGPGEYPYRTVMQTTTCESMAYNLKNLGFASHAIHNNDATFYDRYKVFANLGYDTFTPIEYMSDYETTPTGWAKDNILTEQIIETLDSTENEDYIYTISVQGHGDYPTELPEGYTPVIQVQGFENEKSQAAFEYYVNQIYEMDQFIKELTDALYERDEKTILVMYGDHLPGFDFEDDDLISGDIFKTQYIMWSNFAMPRKNRNVEAYQLSSYVLGRLGISEGIITKFHQKQSGSEDYLKNLKVLEYDALYGNCTAYGGTNPFKPTELAMGVNPICISDAYVYKDYTCIVGENFNDFSVVYINGKEYTSETINNDLIRVSGVVIKEGDAVSVVQRGEDKIELGRVEFIAENVNN